MKPRENLPERGSYLNILIFSGRRTEGQCVIGLLTRRAGPKGSAARFVISIDIGIGAVVLEVRIERNAGRRASLRGVVRTRAAGGRISRIGINQASRLATDGEASGIKGPLERSRAVWSKVDLTSGDMTPNVIVDSSRKVITIDKTDIVVVISVAS